MLKFMRNFFGKLWGDLFKTKKSIKLGLYGPPNAGKTTLANKICQDYLGEDLGKVSHMPHETREISVKDELLIKNADGKELKLSLVDTPGIATKIDFEDFVKSGMSIAKSKRRAREATKGVIESIKWLDEIDTVVLVVDATQDPYSQVNVTIVGNLQARNIPVLIVANKVDLRKSNLKRVQAAFPQYDVVGISAKYSKNIDLFYDSLFKLARMK